MIIYKPEWIIIRSISWENPPPFEKIPPCFATFSEIWDLDQIAPQAKIWGFGTVFYWFSFKNRDFDTLEAQNFRLRRLYNSINLSICLKCCQIGAEGAENVWPKSIIFEKIPPLFRNILKQGGEFSQEIDLMRYPAGTDCGLLQWWFTFDGLVPTSSRFRWP